MNMKKIFFALLACSSVSMTNAQTAATAIEGKILTPQERYFVMKTNSQTFQDYKVIKENILDAVWKITMDSLSKRDGQLAEANTKVNSLQNDLKRIQSELKAKEDSMTDVLFASTHISVLGRGVTKKTFLIIVATAVIALGALIVLLLVNLRSMQVFVSESNLIVKSITEEFEEFKRNALDKQSKLSRELQTERNKLMELKSGRA
jgi:hypothetical protein